MSIVNMNTIDILFSINSYESQLAIYPRVGLLCQRLCLYSVLHDVVSFLPGFWWLQTWSIKSPVKRKEYTFYPLFPEHFPWQGHWASIIEVITPTLLIRSISTSPYFTFYPLIHLFMIEGLRSLWLPLC